jgi:predicted dehydrogenase
MVHFAIVGCGGEAQGHAQILRSLPDARVTALVSQTASHVHRFQEEFFPEAAAYTEYEQLLDNPPEKLDAVLLLTPHALHYPQAKSALERNLHVLTEKPMVTQTDHAHDLWRLTHERQRVLSITFQAPFSAEYQFIRQLKETNKLGRVQLLNGWLAQDWMSHTLLTWRQDPSLAGGGQLYDSGSHVINAMLWLMTGDAVVDVACFIDHCGTPVDINGVAILRFASGAMASLCIGGSSVGWDVRLMMQTDQLAIHTDPHGAFLDIKGNAEHRYPAVPYDAAPGAFTPHRNFVNAILGREPSQLTPRHGVVLSTLMDALYDAAHTRSVVKVADVPDLPDLPAPPDAPPAPAA